MYQMYLGARLVGVGGQLLSLDSIHVDRFPGCKAAGWPLARRRPRRIRIVTAQPSSASSLEALMIGGYCPALVHWRKRARPRRPRSWFERVPGRACQGVAFMSHVGTAVSVTCPQCRNQMRIRVGALFHARCH
jgi:hypothetical protein